MNLAIIDCKTDRRTDSVDLEKTSVEAEILDKPGAKALYVLAASVEELVH